jgi:hypothetical protein
MVKALSKFAFPWFPCAAHRVDLCVKALTKIRVIKFSEKQQCYHVKDWQEDGSLRKTRIDESTKNSIEATNCQKEKMNSIGEKTERETTPFQL